ncbi:unnamed protein product [Ixodes pacificus]
MKYFFIIAILLLGCTLGRSDHGCPTSSPQCHYHCEKRGYYYGLCFYNLCECHTKNDYDWRK